MALEYLVGAALPGKLKQTAAALQALYNEDIVVEVPLDPPPPLAARQLSRPAGRYCTRVTVCWPMKCEGGR